MKKKKITELIFALTQALPFDMEMQYGFNQFLCGKLPLSNRHGLRLNPYDYMSESGDPLLRFGHETQENYATEVMSARLERHRKSRDSSNLRYGQSPRQGQPRTDSPLPPQSHGRRIVFDRLELDEAFATPRNPQDLPLSGQCRLEFVVETDAERPVRQYLSAVHR